MVVGDNFVVFEGSQFLTSTQIDFKRDHFISSNAKSEYTTGDKHARSVQRLKDRGVFIWDMWQFLQTATSIDVLFYLIYSVESVLSTT